MRGEFDDIRDYPGWKAKLKQLLAEAEKASRKDDDAARLAVVARLNRFVLESSPNTPQILALDGLAGSAARELSVAVAAGAADRIAARTASVRSIAKTLNAVSGEAERTAAAIKLARASRVIEALSASLRLVGDLDRLLDDGSDEELRRRLGKLAEAMRDLRNDVEEAARSVAAPRPPR